MRILMVCTANICRSPTAEAVMRHRLGRAGLLDRIELDSAGTRAGSTPMPADPRSPVQAATTAPPDRPAVSLMVTFATGSATLTPQAEAVLASLARAFAAPCCRTLST